MAIIQDEIFEKSLLANTNIQQGTELQLGRKPSAEDSTPTS